MGRKEKRECWLYDLYVSHRALNSLSSAGGQGFFFSVLSLWTTAPPPGPKGVLCLLPPNQRSGVVSEFVRKADSVGGISSWPQLCSKLIWNRAFLGTQKSFCRWIRIFYTHSSQNAVPKSATWGLPNLARRSQRVNISGFKGQEATCNLCHSYTTDVVWKWPETLGQWMSAAVFTGIRKQVAGHLATSHSLFTLILVQLLRLLSFSLKSVLVRTLNFILSPPRGLAGRGRAEAVIHCICHTRPRSKLLSKLVCLYSFRSGETEWKPLRKILVLRYSPFQCSLRPLLLPVVDLGLWRPSSKGPRLWGGCCLRFSCLLRPSLLWGGSLSWATASFVGVKIQLFRTNNPEQFKRKYLFSPQIMNTFEIRGKHVGNLWSLYINSKKLKTRYLFLKWHFSLKSSKTIESIINMHSLNTLESSKSLLMGSLRTFIYVS